MCLPADSARALVRMEKFPVWPKSLLAVGRDSSSWLPSEMVVNRELSLERVLIGMAIDVVLIVTPVGFSMRSSSVVWLYWLPVLGLTEALLVVSSFSWVYAENGKERRGAIGHHLKNLRH